MEKASVLGLREFIYYGSQEIKNSFRFTYREYFTPELTEIILEKPELPKTEESIQEHEKPKNRIPRVFWLIFLMLAGILLLLLRGINIATNGVSL